MPERKALQTIHVQRDDKAVVVKAGTTFNFTDDELKDIKRMSPNAVRPLVNEGTTPDEIEAAQINAAKEQDKANELAKKEAIDRAAKNPTKPVVGKKSASDL